MLNAKLLTLISPPPSVEDLDSIMSGLNPRGTREGELRERLLQQREGVERRLRKCQPGLLAREEEAAERLEEQLVAEVEKRRNKTAPGEVAVLEAGGDMGDLLELALRDQVLLS